MRIGLLADIHDDALNLRRALREFDRQHVDQVVVLGDTVTWPDPEPVAEVARLLQAAGAIGVWGNHDLGLCHEVDEAMRRTWAPDVLKFMSTMRPRLELGPCHFSHVEPWLDPYERPATVALRRTARHAGEGVAQFHRRATPLSVLWTFPPLAADDAGESDSMERRTRHSSG